MFNLRQLPLKYQLDPNMNPFEPVLSLSLEYLMALDNIFLGDDH